MAPDQEAEEHGDVVDVFVSQLEAASTVLLPRGIGKGLVVPQGPGRD